VDGDTDPARDRNSVFGSESMSIHANAACTAKRLRPSQPYPRTAGYDKNDGSIAVGSG
jgi:hypothetical protein